MSMTTPQLRNAQKKFLIGNAFSLNMIPDNLMDRIRIRPLDKEAAQRIVNKNNIKSIIGHQETAKVISNELWAECPYNRESVILDGMSVLLVVQYRGSRLAEGATVLPKDATLAYYKVSFKQIYKITHVSGWVHLIDTSNGEPVEGYSYNYEDYTDEEIKQMQMRMISKWGELNK